MQQWRGGRVKLVRVGRARASAGDQERHIVERGPARAVDDLLHDRREVRRALGQAMLAHRGPRVRRPGRGGCRPRKRGHVEADGRKRAGVVNIIALNEQRRRAGLHLIGLELDIGVGDDGALRKVDAGEADADRLAGAAVIAQFQIVDIARYRTGALLLDIVAGGRHPRFEDGVDRT